MSGGSVEPEDETDVRCDHCCRYYRTDGIHAHEASCPLKEADVVVLAPDEHDDLVARAEGSGGLGETPGTPRSDPSTSSHRTSETTDRPSRSVHTAERRRSDTRRISIRVQCIAVTAVASASRGPILSSR